MYCIYEYVVLRILSWQRARKQKMQRLFKQGVSKVVKERAEEMDQLARKGSLYVMDAFAGRSVKPLGFLFPLFLFISSLFVSRFVYSLRLFLARFVSLFLDYMIC